MSLVRWKPFHEMQDIQREMNRLFNDVLSSSARPDGFGLSFSPAAELEETDDNYQLKLEIPGMEPKELNVEVTAESVSISGERKSEKTEESNGSTRSEFRYGRFQRVIPLPGRIDNQNVTADYKNGVLHLTLPKAEDEKNKVVKVSLG
ncbi:MAG: Hsp20/alpha crystallin family protein [Thainema sp.]